MSSSSEMEEAIELSNREPQTPEMNKLRQSLRRKKPSYVPEASRPHQWQADEEAVRKGKCNFPVRYLGLVEVEESRGMHVCEEAVKKLKVSGKKTVKAVLWVSADGLRVVDDKTKDLIVDQTIEKVSFCAPDRNYDKAFSYICRDGTTRRWICHCFMALKDSGERLSHAVGCAFAACLERKQRREKECGVTASFDASRTSFVREGSFRINASCQQGGERDDIMKQLQEKKKDLPCAVPALPPGTASPPEGAASPVDRAEPGGPHAIPRRHAPIEQLVRQGSFRGFPALSGKNSPFKRQLSLRLNDLPSTLQRKTDFQTKNPVPEMDLSVSGEADGINALCSQINTSFTKPSEELFSNPPSAANGMPACAPPPALPPPPAPLQATSSWVQAEAPLQSPPPVSLHSGHRRTPSEAERWLEEVAKAVKAQQQTPPSTLAPPPSQPAPPIPIIPGPPGSTMSAPPMPLPPMSLPPMSLPSMSALPMSLPPMSLPSMSVAPMSLPSMSLPSMSAPSMPSSAMSCPPISVPLMSCGPMSNPPMSVPMSVPMSLPSMPCPPMSHHSGPPMSLPSMTVPSMSGPTMTGAPMLCGPLPGALGSLPSAMQPFPLAFDATPAPVGMYGPPPLQPAFMPMQAYMPGLAASMAASMAYPSASVPVVGITPSQMVANVFSAGGASMGMGGAKTGVLGGVGHHHGFPNSAPQSGGFSAPPFGAPPPAVNGLSSSHNNLPASAAAAGGGSTATHNGTAASNGGCGNSGWPQEALQPAAPAASGDAHEAERFEAKWAALETKQPSSSSSQQPKAAANPFSNELQKTFEIEL